MSKKSNFDNVCTTFRNNNKAGTCCTDLADHTNGFGKRPLGQVPAPPENSMRQQNKGIAMFILDRKHSSHQANNNEKREYSKQKHSTNNSKMRGVSPLACPANVA